MAVPARICTLYVTTDLRELRDGRRASAPDVSRAGSGVSVPVCASAVGLAEASSNSSVVCSSFVISDMTLAPSSRLVGGVEMGGDALDVARAVTRRGRLTDAGAGRATVPTYTREWREVAPNKVRMGQSGLHCAACRRNRHGDYVGVRSVAG